MATATKLTTAQQKALDALSGMRTIVKKEMALAGEYISDEIDEEKKNTGAICGGHKTCAIGSLWIGYGIKPRRRHGGFLLAYTGQDQRARAYRKYEGLGLAVGALNDAALAAADRNGYTLADFKDPIEALFEGEEYGRMRTDGLTLDKAALLRIIDSAKRRVVRG